MYLPIDGPMAALVLTEYAGDVRSWYEADECGGVHGEGVEGMGVI